MKKIYVSPQLDILILEQTDIIATSGGGNVSGGNVNPPSSGGTESGGGHGGVFDGWED